MIDYKMKYLELRAKLLESSQVSFRLGYEQGYQASQQESQQQAIQSLSQPKIGPDGKPIQPNDGQQVDPNSQQDPNANPSDPTQTSQGVNMQNEVAKQGQEVAPENSELDQHISELEGLVAKGEKPSLVDLRNTVMKLAELRKNQIDLMTKKQVQTGSSQKQFIKGILDKWDSESSEELDLDNIIKESRLNLDNIK